MIMQAHLTCWFYHNIFVKREPIKQSYLYMKRLQSSATFKQKDNHKVSCD